MRGVAAEVDVTPMALYHHVRDREELLVGMVEHLLSEVPDVAGDSLAWQIRLRTIYLGLRLVAQDHPMAFPLVLDHGPSRQVDRLRAAGFRALVDAGVPHSHRAHTEAMVWTLLLGHTTREALGAFRHLRPGRADRSAAAVLVLVERYVNWVVESPEMAFPIDRTTEWDLSEDDG